MALEEKADRNDAGARHRQDYSAILGNLSGCRGRYRHYKNGQDYEVIGVVVSLLDQAPLASWRLLDEYARHSEAGTKHVVWMISAAAFAVAEVLAEPHVLYRALYGNFGLWLRPASMFFGHVTLGSDSVPRFAPLPSQNGIGD